MLHILNAIDLTFDLKPHKGDYMRSNKIYCHIVLL